MLSGSQIRNISDVAAYRAAEEGRKPLTLWAEKDIRHIPFLGHYVPAGYRVATWADLKKKDVPVHSFYGGSKSTDEVWLECGGWGSSPVDAFLSTGHYWGIVESGEFQTYARLYVQEAGAPEQNVPDEDSVKCSECGEVHNDLEECADYGEDD